MSSEIRKVNKIGANGMVSDKRMNKQNRFPSTRAGTFGNVEKDENTVVTVLVWPFDYSDAYTISSYVAFRVHITLPIIIIIIIICF